MREGRLLRSSLALSNAGVVWRGLARLGKDGRSGWARRVQIRFVLAGTAGRVVSRCVLAGKAGQGCVGSGRAGIARQDWVW